MIKITHAPWKEIIIHEIIEHKLDDFLQLRCIGVAPGGLGKPLLWIDGLALDRTSMLETESIVQEKLDGKLHWSSLSYAFMPKFKAMVVLREGNVRIPIINVSNSPFFQAVSKWLKETQ